MSNSNQRPGRFTLAGLLAGLLFLFLSSPSALAHSIPPGCTGSGLGVLLFTDAPDVHIGDTLNYSATVFNGTGVGPLVCDATSIQAFVVTPDGISHPIVLRRTTLTNGQSDYYTNVVSYVVRAQDVQPDGTVRATASDTGIIHQNDTDSQGGGNQGVNTEVSLPCIQITVQCVGSIGENGAINFTGTVANCGNNTLVGVTVTNFVNGGLFHVTFITNLLRNETATFSGSWIPSNPCFPSTATLVAQGIDQFTTRPRTVTSSASTTCSEVLTPGIKVTKACPAAPVSPGQLLVFSGSVSNTGNVTLNNIVVVNDQPAANTPVFTLDSLAPGAVANFTGSYTAPTNCAVSDALTARAVSVCGVAITNTASATCPILTTPRIVVTAVCPATPVTPGGSVTYTGTVRNSGDILLTNVVVVADQPAANTPVIRVASLAPGASASFTTSFAIPANACSVTTIFAVAGEDICSGNTPANTVSVTCPVLTAPGIALTFVCPNASIATGGLLIYTGTVRNTGNVTLNNVTVVNNQAVPSTVRTVLFLAPGASENFTSTFTAPVDVCSVTSTVTTSGTDACTGALVTNSASATCPLSSVPGIAVTQICPAAPAIPGGLLTYSGTVRNTGDITLTNVIVLNNLSGATPVFTTATLAPGAAASFTGSYLAPTNCSATSISTATGRSICGVAVTNAASATCPVLMTPQITVTAVCPTVPVTPDALLTYTGTVRNTGNITLTNVVVVSDQPAPNSTVLTLATLAPGASANYTASFTVPVNACAVTTTVAASGKDNCTGTAAANTVSVTCPVITAPGIALTFVCPNASIAAGGLIIYTGTVRNTGNVTLNNVSVVNNQAAPSTVRTVLFLAPGASENFTATFTAPVDVCSVTSTVTTSGTDACTGALVTNSASATCPLTSAPAIAVTQVCPVSPTIPGGPLTFSGTVRNTGNITLTNVVVLNNLIGSTPVFTATTLTPGAAADFTGSYVAPANCSSTSTLTATGRSICGASVTNTASATCPILTAPAIEVTQTCPATSVLPGGILTYNGTVRNTGNFTLTNIAVINNRPGSNTVVFTLATLAPGVSANFTGSYQVPMNCCVVSSTLEARGQGCAGVTVTDTATRTCPVLTLPNIVITKSCVPGVLRPGDRLSYSGTISNAGNITLINVTVSNSQSPGSRVLGPLTLVPNESVDYNASYIVPLDFCGTDTVTATGLDSCTFFPVVAEVTTTCPVITTPRIAVTKNCPPQPTVRGGIHAYTGTVSNPGNVTLVNVFVVDNQPSINTPVIGPITLAPGASVNFAGSYMAPMDCCEITDTLSARGEDRCLGTRVTSTASAICPLLTIPSITLVQDCPPNPIPMGSVYNFSGFVTNTGTIVLTNVFVFGPQGTNAPVLGPIELAPGESELYSGTYTVPFNICSVAVTAVGQDTCGGFAITNTAGCPVATTPSVAITQNCPPNPVTPGGLVIYSGSIRNAGNITLTNLSVSNDRSGTDPVLLAASLAPGASTTFSGSYIAPASGNTTSTSTVRGASLCGVEVANAASSTCPILTSPGIAITKACPAQPVTAGGQLVFTGTVTNVGNVILTNVIVVNSQPVSNTRVLGPITLAPGAGTSFTASYPIGLGACFTEDTLVATGNDNSNGIAVSSTVSATCPIITVPSVAITLNCPPNPVAPGGLLTYSGTIRNAGNITLNNIEVTNDRSGASPVLSLASLTPGSSANFTGSYIAPFSGPATSTASVRAMNLCGVGVTNSASSTCPIQTSPGLAITKACPAQPVSAGGILVFTGTVTNVGNVILTNVFVVNSQPVPNTAVLGPITLAPGTGTSFTSSYTVALDACFISDTLVATGNDNSTGSAVTSSVSATCPIVTIPSMAITLNCPASPVTPGGLLTYSGSIRNAGTITLNNIVVINDRTGAAPVLSLASLTPGSSANFSGSYIAPAVGDASSTASVSATSLCGVVVTNAASSTCPIVTSAGIAITKACPPQPATAGGTLVFTGTVTNTGNITLTNVFVVNSQPLANTPVLGPITLAPGAGTSFTASYTVALDACFTSDTLVATGNDANTGSAVTSSVSATCPIITVPSIAITQNCPPSPASPGGLLTYSGSVRNAGTITLNNIVVTNDRSGATPILTVASLAPGASADFTGSYSAPAIGDATSTSSVRATSLCGIALTNSASSTCPIVTAAGIAITKACPPLPTTAGGTLVFTGTVTNTGNITLTNVFVVNNQPAANTPVLGPITLAPGQGASFTASYPVALDACSTSDTLTATGVNANTGNPVSSSVSATCPIITIPSIAITQNCPSSPVTPGGLLTYSGSVRNAGTITLNNIVVTNDRSGATPVLTVASLAPGASANFTGSYVAPAVGDATSTSTVRATSLCGVAVTNSASSTCPILTSAGIAITKACPAVAVIPGGTLVYTGTITNAGNVILTNVFVVNNQPAANTVILGPITLAPGQGTNFTASYVVPIDACTTTDTLTATGNNASTGATVTSSVSPVCLVNTSASIAMTQDCPPSPASPGGLLTYTGSIRNAGVITLTNIVVTNDRSGAAPILTVASLAPGATANFTGSYTAPASGPATSTSSARATSLCGVTVTNTATLTCPLVVNAPAIAVTLVCPVVPAASGGSITYTGTVRNTGNVALTPVVVVIDQPVPNTAVLTVPSLAPGASANFTTTFTTAANTCSVSSTVTARGTDASTAAVVTSSASATCPLTTAPAITITQNCLPVSGGVASYNGVVRNTGNVTLNNVFVVSSQPVNNTPVLGPITLAPGASAPFSATYAAAGGPATVALQSATSFAVLAGAGITVAGAVNSTSITGDIGTFPTTTITGLGNVVLTGVNHGGDAVTQTAKNDLVTAYNSAAGRTPTTTFTPIFDLGGRTLAPGVYRNPSSFGITGTLTLDAGGDPNAAWIFQMGSTLTTASSSSVVLLNGAQAANIFWQVGSSATLGTGSNLKGTILALDSITVTTGSSLTGRALARNGAVTLDVNSIVIPPAAVAPNNTVTATGIDNCEARTVTAKADCAGPVALSSEPVQSIKSVVPFIASMTVASGMVTVSWTAAAGVTYCLQCTDGSQNPVWINIPGNVTASGDTASKTSPMGTDQKRFYRVMVVQP